MSAASNYTESNTINALLRGVAFPLPTGTYISLHTGAPGESGAQNEVSTSAWPAYVRKRAEDGGAIGTGWSAPSDGVSANLKQMLYPSNNGVSGVTVTHFAVWDAATAGNCLAYAQLNDARTLLPGDVFVFDAGSITIQML